jgi:multiple sugar transport system permease protein
MGPMLYSLYLSFLEWDFLTESKFIYFTNYVEIFTDDPLFYKSMLNTFIWAAFLPLGIILSILLALLLNTKIKGVKIFRTIFYVPVIVPMVANSLLWLWLFNPEIGMINQILRFVNLPTSNWLLSESMVIPALVIMSLWQVGGGVVIFLAALQGVPTDLYEAASIDGAGEIKKFWNITIPIISPAIFFQLITGVIGALQVFTQGYIMTNGGPQNRTLFIMLYIYREAFENFNIGYASALSWVLFVVISILSVIMFKTVGKKIYYN